MRSTRSRSLAQRSGPRPLTVSLVALTFAAGCGSDRDAPPTDMHEVRGAVQSWPGEAEASCGARLTVQRFADDVGARAATETRALITSAQAYREYFGHAPPASVNLGREWVVFYAAGKQPTAAHTADVSVVGARGDVLHVVTTLTAPIPPCSPPPSSGSGGSSGSSGGASGTAGAGATMPVGSDAAGSTSGAPAEPGIAIPLPPSPSPLPPPPPVREYLPYVLVKFAAQATHSVDFQHQDILPSCGGSPPPPNPCSAILCGPGQTCVVLETYPPRARCVTNPNQSCLSSAQCTDGLVCSTELGRCGANPSCAPNTPCDTACWGTCVKKPEPTPTLCTSSATCPQGTRCSTERGDCQGCGRGPEVVCPAVCFGVCEPAPTDVCSGSIVMGGCRSEEVLKAEAAEACKRAGLALRDFGVGDACFAGGFAIARYTCCGSSSPPPPPPVCKVDSDCRLSSYECGQSPCTCSAQPVAQPRLACGAPAIACLVDPCADQQAACVAGQCVAQRQPATCTWSYMGGAGACRSYDAWKQAAHEACRVNGATLSNLSTGATCTGGFAEVKYECCPIR